MAISLYCEESKKASFGAITLIIKFHSRAILVPEDPGKLRISGKLGKVSLFYYLVQYSLLIPSQIY